MATTEQAAQRNHEGSESSLSAGSPSAELTCSETDVTPTWAAPQTHLATGPAVCPCVRKTSYFPSALYSSKNGPDDLTQKLIWIENSCENSPGCRRCDGCSECGVGIQTAARYGGNSWDGQMSFCHGSSPRQNRCSSPRRTICPPLIAADAQQFSPNSLTATMYASPSWSPLTITVSLNSTGELQ